MPPLRHLLGLVVTFGLIGGAIWLWLAYPDLVSQGPLRSWRTDLMTWRIPILAVFGFLTLSGLQWIADRIAKP